MPTTHPSQKSGTSQCAAILRRLEQDRGEWVSLIDLWRVSSSMAVHSRINDLRQLGHTIDHHNERDPESGKIHSYYKLIAPAEPAADPISTFDPQTSPLNQPNLL
jgi:hypothetical protein